MPMLGSRLQSAANASVLAKLRELQEPKIPSDADAGQRSDIDQQLQDLAEAVASCMPDIIAEIAGNAQVTSTVVVTSVAGVMPGGGVSGPGSGTATGTVA